MTYREQWSDLTRIVTEAVNQADPMGLLEIGAPFDEYEPEIRDLLAGLGDAWPDETAVMRLCEEVFAHWFGPVGVDPRRMEHLAQLLVTALRDIQLGSR